MDKETRKSLIQVANISGMGIALGVTVFGCFFVGLYLDRKLGTGKFFAFLFLLLGVFVGFKNIYVLLKKSLNDEKPLGKKDGTGEDEASSKEN